MEPATAVGRAGRREAIQRLLDLLRTELRADACVLFTFGDGVSTVRALAGDGRRFGIAAGVRRSLTGAPMLAALFRSPGEIRAYLGVRVPIDASGRGAMLCALGADRETVWGTADERLARVLADVIRNELTERPRCRGAAR